MQQQWCLDFDARAKNSPSELRNRIECPISCFSGGSDKAVRAEKWKALISHVVTTGPKQHGFVFMDPLFSEKQYAGGNHFFIFDNPTTDLEIAADVADVLQLAEDE